MTFNELNVQPELIAALARQDIAEPTPIQEAALPVLATGRDAYLHAETGTGKTLAYLLPIFGRLEVALAATQAVIVAPTHELALQIHRQCCDLARNAGWPIRSVLLIGGTSTERQIEKLKKKPHLVVGSPGRVAELIAKGKLKMKDVRTVVIDEADRLVNAEALASLLPVIKAAPVSRQLVFASATVEDETTAALKDLAPDLIMLHAGSVALNKDIEHLYLVCDERDKPDELRKLLHAMAPERAIVFVHRNDLAAKVADRLAHHHIRTADLNAARDKQDRKAAMDGLRSGGLKVLIASDVAARGLDIKGVTHVFNFDVPTMPKAYLHRVGRTGRAGVKGTAITLATEIEVRVIPRYEQELGIRLQQVRMREGKVRRVD